MPITFADYSPEHATAVEACNGRLIEGGVEAGYLLPARALEPVPAGRCIRPRWRLAVDGDVAAGGAVRGGYLLKTQRFLAGGSPVEAGGYQAPISEGIVNRKYGAVGLQLLQDALKQTPFLFTTGWGGLERPVAKLLAARGFTLRLAPFRFRIRHAGRFFRQVSAVRSTPARRAAADLLAATGLGWLAARALHWRSLLPGPGGEVRTEDRFGDWAEEIWERTRDEFCWIAERTAPVLRELYPPAGHCRIVRVPGAWAVTWMTEMRGNAHFGDLRLGTVLDCLAGPGQAEAVARAAAATLEEQGADLIVTNQTAEFMLEGFRRAGFHAGPSNYGLSVSPALLQVINAKAGPWHMTRGDGDGRVNL
jgi:hypothetical protein